MIQSMTAYGKASGFYNDNKITVELRSVNSKFLDANLRFPGIYKEKEIEIRKILAEKVKRGKVDLLIYLEKQDNNGKHQINESVLKAYYENLKSISENLGEKPSYDNLLQIAVKLPEVISAEIPELKEEEWIALQSIINEAIISFNEFRINEGNDLAKDLHYRIVNIQDLLKNCIQFEQERIETIKERIKTNLTENIESQPIDKNRFEQELIYYLEKIDITEEKIRLKSHCEHFVDTLNTNESNGKKLGFISQEIGREINTLGSKSYHAEMQKQIVSMKDELEKIKEQVLNIV